MTSNNYLLRNFGKTAILLLCFIYIGAFAQQTDIKSINKSEFKLHKKGDYYINWGYNRSWFNTSDIHFYGQGHDFILYDVKAADRPTKFSLDYINPSTWSAPQFNFRAGYFLTDKYSISIGWDHMKYVATDNQIVNMFGYIDPSKAIDPLMKTNMASVNSKYSITGFYNDVAVKMTPDDFIHFEHTDGLNYASVDIERHDKLWQSLKHEKIGLTFVSGAGGGLIVPRTDSHLFGSGRNHFWNIAGWGGSAKVGVQLNLTKHIYLQSDFKYGYLQLINIHTTNHENYDKAQQHIVFYENYWLIGFRF